MAEGSGEVVVVPATGSANSLNNGAGGTSAQTSNPLSRKLRKILDTRLDNDKVSGAGGAEGRASRGDGVRGWSSVRRPRSGLVPASRWAPQARRTPRLRCRRGADEKGNAEETLEKRRGFQGITSIYLKGFLEDSGSGRQTVEEGFSLTPTGVGPAIKA